MKIRKAIFPVAGLGTRFLPVTKATPKEMIPVIGKPLIQYATDEAIAAGIDTLIFVSGRNKRAIEDHFDTDHGLEEKLAVANKHEALAEVRNILPDHINCIYIRQSGPLGLGHAIACAAPVIDDEPFAVLLADELMLSDKGEGILSQLCKVYEQHHCSVVAVDTVEQSEIGKYGIVEGKELANHLLQVNRFIEKPQAGETDSNLAIIGRYILTPEIMGYLQQTKPGVGGEIQLTDALTEQLGNDPFIAYQYYGMRYDCGNQHGLLRATIALALKHPKYKEDLRRQIEADS